MKFSHQTRDFAIGSIPVIGNRENGSIIGLDKDGKTYVEALRENPGREPRNEKEKQLHQALLSGHFLVEDGAEGEAEDKGGIVSAYLHVTQNCNLHCVGCYSYNKDRNASDDADTEKMKLAIRRLCRAGLKTLVISGGEPFLRKDLPELLRTARDGGVERLDIITNGTVLDKEKLLAVKPYVDTIAVSVDGFSAEHDHYIRDEGIFDAVTRSIQLLKSLGMTVSVLPTVHRKNCEYMDDYVAYARGLGAEISFSLLTCPPYSQDDEERNKKEEGEESLSSYLFNDEQLRFIGDKLTHLGQEGIRVLDSPQDMNFSCSRSCGVCRNICSVGFDGSVYPCHMLHYEELILGNIFENDLEDIMRTGKAQQIRSIDVDTFTGCKDCIHKNLCGGGCRARSYFKYGDFRSHDFYCPMTMDFFNRASKLLNDMYGEK